MAWSPERSSAEGVVRSMPDLPELDPIVHGRLRLAILSLLSGVDEAEFTWLRAKTDATDGNLGAQLLKLEEAGYVAVKKKFVLRKPQTMYRITDRGRKALTEYVKALKKLLGGAIS
jgi:DNA-binding transcriptional ArsR family regulator